MASLGLRFDLLSRGARGAERDLERVGSASGRTGVAVGRLGKALAIGFGGAIVGGVAALGASLKGGLEEAISYQRITDQLAQTLKSTGGAANVSVDQLKKYAGELESISGVDEELILNSQNVLATFTGIRNEVGKGNDVYNQASLAALNLSTTLGTDVSGAAVQVGKALNDPIKGITALGKAGVSFTTQQKEQIKTLVKSGDTLGAQKIILGELNKEFGGAAAAAGEGFGGTIARLKDVVSDTFRDIATRALPTLTRLADFLGKNLPGAIEKTADFLGKLKEIAGQVIPALRDFGASVIPKLVAAFQTSRAVIESVVAGLKGMVEFVRSNATTFTVLGGAVAGVTVVMGTFLAVTKAVTIATKIQAAVTRVMAGAQLLLNLAVSANPFVIAAVAIGAIVGALVAVYFRSERFRTIINSVGAVIREKVLPVLASLGRFLVDVGRKVFTVIGFFVRFQLKILSIQLAIARFVVNAIGKIGRLPGAAREVVSKVASVIGELPGKILALGGKMLNAGKTIIGKLFSGLGQAGGAVTDFAGAIGGAIRQFVNTQVIDRINSALQFSIPVPGLPDINIDPPNIPHLAQGGIVKARRGGTLAVIGEGGQDEAVIPLPRGYSAGGGIDTLIAEMRRQTEAILILAGTPRQASANARTRLAGMAY